MAFSTTGNHLVNVRYSGDANYATTSTVTALPVVNPTTLTESLSSMAINAGQSVTVTGVPKSSAKSPAMTGTFIFSGNPFLYSVGPVVPTLSADASGNQVLTATATVTPLSYSAQNVSVDYSGDSNFEAGSTSVSMTVNPPDFTVGTSAPGMTIVAGNTGTATVTLSPATNLSSSVSLSCNVALVGGTCSFNPPSPFNFNNGTPVTTTVSISTLPASTSLSTQFLLPRPPEARRFPPGDGWLIVLADGMAILILSLWSGRKFGRLAATVGMICLLLLVIGCGTGGGGGGGPAPTTLTLSTTSTRVTSGGTITMSVTVNPSTATGTIALSDQSGVLTTTSVVNGSAQIQLANPAVGTHVISAQYSGDANNLPSQTSGTLSVLVTGTVTATIQGATGALTHNAPLSVTIQ